MKRKIGTLLLAVSFVVTTALSGCGGTTTSSDSSTNSSTAAISSAAAESTAVTSTGIDPKTLKPVKLLFLTMGETPKNLKAVNDEASKYLTEKINATLEYRPIQW
ncbi:MAG: hypothetical protein ACYDG2_16740, partial [Ruminiclostridium sp.]